MTLKLEGYKSNKQRTRAKIKWWLCGKGEEVSKRKRCMDGRQTYLLVDETAAGYPHPHAGAQNSEEIWMVSEDVEGTQGAESGSSDVQVSLWHGFRPPEVVD